MHDRPTSSFSRSAFQSSLLTQTVRVLLLMAAAHAMDTRVHAQEAEAEAERVEEVDAPSRIVGMLSAGVPLRLTLDKTLDQSRIAPAFGNVLLGYELPGGQLRHGFGVGLSWNMSHEGGYTTPVYAGDQLVLMPAYLAYYKLNPDVFGIGHVGIPILVRGGSSAGLEVGAMIAYRLTAGTGVFAGLDLDAYNALGFNLLASLELGIVVDYEVLP